MQLWEKTDNLPPLALQSAKALVWGFPGQRLFAIEAGTASLWLALAMMEVPAYRFAHGAHCLSLSLIQGMAVIAIACLFFTGIVLCFNVWWRWGWEKRVTRRVGGNCRIRVRT